MKTLPNSRVHVYLTRVGIFLAVVALIAMMIGCEGEGEGEPAYYYELGVNSTAGGSVTTPAEGISEYDPGESVDLVAEAEEGYRFVEWTGDVGSIGDADAAMTYIIMTSNYSITADFVPKCTPMVAAGGVHTVGLKSNGRVVAVGLNDDGQCDVGDWRNVIQVAAGDFHTVGLKFDGNVVAVGYNDFEQCDVGNWMDIAQVAAGGVHTVGLSANGTAAAVGENSDGQCDVGNWTDITQVAAGVAHTVGLEANGSVVAAGDNGGGQCNVGNWT
ncbi:MAG: hypothetical protein KAQ73_03940, partial [Dehalococcoidia bacterium]|nr:hypothetical protein [Dehalococcoidia bacterium]